MKKIFLLLFLVCFLPSLFAQGEVLDKTSNVLAEKQKELSAKQASLKELEGMISTLSAEIKQLSTPPQYWDFSIFSTLAANYAQYDNWVAGGENSFSLIGTHDMGLRYVNTEKKYSWDNMLSAMIGYRTQGSILGEWLKTNDVLSLSSTFKYALTPKLSLASNLVLRTQLLATRNYALDERPKVSNFLAPGYINLGVGVDWKTAKWLSVYLSPITLQSTVVIDDEVDPVSFGIDEGQTSRSEIGWYMNATAQASLSKSITFSSRLLLFGNYLADGPTSGIDVDWNLRLDAKLGKNFFAFFFVNLKYDADAQVIVAPAEGSQPAIYRAANLQSYQNIGLGASFKISKKYK